MGGYFGVVSKRDAIEDVFFGTDYHSHLGTRRAGIAAFDEEIGLQRTGAPGTTAALALLNDQVKKGGVI